MTNLEITFGIATIIGTAIGIYQLYLRKKDREKLEKEIRLHLHNLQDYRWNLVDIADPVDNIVQRSNEKISLKELQNIARLTRNKLSTTYDRLKNEEARFLKQFNLEKEIIPDLEKRETVFQTKKERKAKIE